MQRAKLEDKVVLLKSSSSQPEQYGIRYNIVITGIPDKIADDKLEDVATSSKKLLFNLLIVSIVRKH